MSPLRSLADGRGQSTARSFDSRGNLTTQVDGRGAISYAYDELNRISSLTDPSSGTFSFGYDDEGNLTSTELPNGVTTTNAYDAANRMTATESVNGSTVLERFGYGYDPAGNRTSAGQLSYAYDALNRLIQWDPPSAPAVDYGYDPAGNRTSQTDRNDEETTHDYNALNQLTADSTAATYGYDGAGRLTTDTDGADTKSYEWDALDQLVGFDDGSGSVSYSYDALGRRAERSTPATTETAHYGDLSDIATLDTDSGGTLRSFLSGPAGLVEQTEGATTSYPLTDAHGDVTALADPAGAVASRQVYEPWGEQLGGPALEMGWLGAQQRRFEPVPGIVQMGVRAYGKETGRMLTEDPWLGQVGNAPSHNRHEYALNNPETNYDLDGRLPLVGNTCLLGFIDCGDSGRCGMVATAAPLLQLACLARRIPGFRFHTASCSIDEFGISHGACMTRDEIPSAGSDTPEELSEDTGLRTPFHPVPVPVRPTTPTPVQFPTPSPGPVPGPVIP